MKTNMHFNADSSIFKNALALRKNLTPAEEKLWFHLRGKQMENEKFRRQHPIKKYILDFYCYRLRLAIEVDGEIHSEKSQVFYDIDRTSNLEDDKLHELRFTNDEVLTQTTKVLEIIRNKIHEIRDNR